MIKRLPLFLIVVLIVVLLQLILLKIGFGATPGFPQGNLEVTVTHTIYPNPTNGTFTLHTEPDVYDRFTLVNILGQTIIDSPIPLNAQDLHFDLSDEPGGTYFYALYRQGEVKVTKKLMKQ